VSGPREIGVEEALSIVEDIGTTAPIDSVPALVGHLERVKLVLQRRFLMPTMNGGAGPDDRLLTAVEAAEVLGCSRRTVYDNAEGYPFTVRQNGRLRFSAAGLQRYLARAQGGGGRR